MSNISPTERSGVISNDEFASLDGIGMAAQIHAGLITPLEAVEAAIRVIEQKNPVVNAVVMTRFDQARAEARALRKPDEGTFAPLWGVPFLLKDVNLYSADMPTTFGSAYFMGDQAKPDSAMVDRWRRGGLTILGKTNTPEFAAEFVTEPRAYGRTINPAAPNLTVGGSSGGAAAAVAAGMVPIAHATDLGGSIRIPAACCGVFGFKPTAGLNPTGPYFSEIAGGLNSDHVITRTVRDSAASLDITADSRPEGGSFLEGLKQPLQKRVIGICDTDTSGNLCGPDQQQALREATRLLAEMGHDLVEYRYPDGLSAGDWYDYLWIFDIVRLVEERAYRIGRDPTTEELEPLTWHLIEKARRGGASAYEQAQSARKAYNARYLGSMQHVDVLVTPTLAQNPPPVGTLDFNSFGDVDAWARVGYGFAPFSIPSNISGQPSASCPYFKNSDGLSIGVQVSGKPEDDLLVLQLCSQLELANT